MGGWVAPYVARRCAPANPSREGNVTNSDTPAKYDVEILEAVLLEITAELHPEHLSRDELLSQIVAKPDDTREVETAAQAIRNLREFSLFSKRDDEIVEPTPAALRAVSRLR
jgi:uncharacterized protein (DUF849 family)